jgi:hypothetical protein
MKYRFSALNGFGADLLKDFSERLLETAIKPSDCNKILFPRKFNHLQELPGILRRRLLYKQVLPRLKRPEAFAIMHVGGRKDAHRINIVSSDYFCRVVHGVRDIELFRGHSCRFDIKIAQRHERTPPLFYKARERWEVALLGHLPCADNANLNGE